MIISLLNILFWVLGIYLLLNCVYLAFFAIAALLPLRKIKTEVEKYRKIAILFPTYQENVVILESVKAALSHQYSGDFEVIVIADGLEKETTTQIQEMGARAIEVQFEKSTKGKAMRFGMNQLKDEGFEMAVVLDVDNEMGEGCLNAMNEAFCAGFRVVQVHRTAKNKDTNFAFLDASNEEVNNQIYRKGPAMLGLSASLIGSGIAFDFDYFLNLLNHIGDTIGEDKKLDFMMAKDRTKVAYLNDIYVYDEKIADAKVFTSQRTRWIASQIEFLKEHSLEGFKELFKGNFEFFSKTLQTFLVPRMLLLGVLFILALQGLFNPIGPSFLFWLALFVSLCLTLLIAIPRSFYLDKRLYIAIWQIPRAIIGMFIALLSIGKAKKSFMATPHSQKPKQG